MELKCSLFGHDYADYDVERERTDHGAEVINTVRTTEACRRCGHTRVVSENTEIAAAGVPESPDPSEETVSERVPASASTTSESGRIADSGVRSDPRFEEGNGEKGRSGAPRPDPDAGDGSPETVGPTAATAGGRSLEESELWCPACAFAEPVLGSALRAGDSCPACTRGYLRRRGG